MRRDSFYPFYGWLIFSGLLIFAGYLLWHFQLLQTLFSADQTYLSLLIVCAFLIITLYLGNAAWQLSIQNQLTLELNKTLTQNTTLNSQNTLDMQPDSMAKQHLELQYWTQQQAGKESESLLARLIEQVHRGHGNGWFLSDLLIRLGLIGTVIGFILMLSTVYELKDNDTQALKELLSTMGSGMQIALYTTLAGMGCGLLVSIQCQWLDRCADKLVSQIIKMSVKPAFADDKAPSSDPSLMTGDKESPGHSNAVQQVHG